MVDGDGTHAFPPPEPAIDDADEVRVIVNGEPVDGQNPLFIGGIEDARAFLRGMAPDQRAEVSVVAPGRIYSAGELLGGEG